MAYGEISFTELCTLLLRFLWLGVLATIDILSYPLSSTKHSLRRTLWRRFVLTMVPNSSFRQIQFVVPPVSVSYKKFAKKHSLPVKSEDIGEGARLHWFGHDHGEYVMLYIHGGGYVTPAIDSQYLLVELLRKEVEAQYRKNISVAFLEYTLSNHTSWPQQGRQSSAALNHLLGKGISPGSIIVAGDSVGAHQVAFLLGHILHPHPRVQPIVSMRHPLAGALLISPWASFEEYAPSFKLNATADVMTVPALRRWANVLKSSREPGDDELAPGYFEPEKAEPEWWAGLSGVVNRVLVTTGGMEVFLDDAVSLGKKMQIGSKMGQEDMEIFVEKDVGHNESIAECATGERPGPTTNRIITWLGRLLI